jgi:hypothetical protein
MQVHHVTPHPARLVGNHSLVGELHQVAAHEARRQPARAQHGDEQHRRVAAAPLARRQRLLGREDARLLADDVADALVHPLVELDDELHRRPRAWQLVEEGLQALSAAHRRLVHVEEGKEVLPQLRRVGERHRLTAVVEEEVERVHRPHVHGHLHRHLELGDADAVGQGDAGHPVAVRILLPAHLAGRGLHGEAIRLDGGAGVDRGAQPDQVRAECGGLRVAVQISMPDEQPHESLQRGPLYTPSRLHRLVFAVAPGCTPEWGLYTLFGAFT